MCIRDRSRRLVTMDMGRKLGRGLRLLFGEGAGSPSSTMSPGPRSTSIPSGILIPPTVWPQYINVLYRQTGQDNGRPRPSPKNKIMIMMLMKVLKFKYWVATKRDDFRIGNYAREKRMYYREIGLHDSFILHANCLGTVHQDIPSLCPCAKSVHVNLFLIW